MCKKLRHEKDEAVDTLETKSKAVERLEERLESTLEWHRQLSDQQTLLHRQQMETTVSEIAKESKRAKEEAIAKAAAWRDKFEVMCKTYSTLKVYKGVQTGQYQATERSRPIERQNASRACRGTRNIPKSHHVSSSRNENISKSFRRVVSIGSEFSSKST